MLFRTLTQLFLLQSAWKRAVAEIYLASEPSVEDIPGPKCTISLSGCFCSSVCTATGFVVICWLSQHACSGWLCWKPCCATASSHVFVFWPASLWPGCNSPHLVSAQLTERRLQEQEEQERQREEEEQERSNKQRCAELVQQEARSMAEQGYCSR